MKLSSLYVHDFKGYREHLFDLQGKEVATLVNSELKPGNYKYEFDGSGLSSGIYFYKLTSGSFAETKQMILLK